MGDNGNISRRAALACGAAGAVGTLMPLDVIERAAWGGSEVGARVRAAIDALRELSGVRDGMAACQRSLALHHPLSPQSSELRDRQFEFMQAQFHAENQAFAAIGRIITGGPDGCEPEVSKLATSLYPNVNAGHIQSLMADGDRWVERPGSGLARAHERPRRVPRDYVAREMRAAWSRLHG